ncbi:MAG: SpoIIIAC/SpoIIIAD family protein [Eisenbergiella sp.]
MDMAKIALLGIIGVLIGLQFKSGKQEYSAYIGIAVALIIFYYVCQYLTQVKDSVLALEVSSGRKRSVFQYFV